MSRKIDGVDDGTRKRMSNVPSENTKPELVVRKIIHSLGYRYRLHAKTLPGKPDIVFKSRRKVIFVNGCFWHYHECRHDKMPQTRKEYWRDKLVANHNRDLLNYSKLNSLGYSVLIIWECEIKNRNRVINKILKFLNEEGPKRSYVNV